MTEQDYRTKCTRDKIHQTLISKVDKMYHFNFTGWTKCTTSILPGGPNVPNQYILVMIILYRIAHAKSIIKRSFLCVFLLPLSTTLNEWIIVVIVIVTPLKQSLSQ